MLTSWKRRMFGFCAWEMIRTAVDYCSEDWEKHQPKLENHIWIETSQSGEKVTITGSKNMTWQTTAAACQWTKLVSKHGALIWISPQVSVCEDAVSGRRSRPCSCWIICKFRATAAGLKSLYTEFQEAVSLPPFPPHSGQQQPSVWTGLKAKANWDSAKT